MAQKIHLNKDSRIEPINVVVNHTNLQGKKVVEIIKDASIPAPSKPTFGKIKDIEFQDGIIELRMYSSILIGAPEQARGFIGVAFRISEDNSQFECIYLRPRNGRDTNQLRRNHSTQYFAYPEYTFSKLRKESSGMYESYADMELNTWIHIRIEVVNQTAKLYINKNKQPALIISDLKNTSQTKGYIGLFVDNGTKGYFKDLKIIHY